MTLPRTASRLSSLYGRQHASKDSSAGTRLLEFSCSKRQASPQPVEAEETLQRRAGVAEASTSGRPHAAHQTWERFMYTLYKLTGQTVGRQAAGKRGWRNGMHDELLLPLRIQATSASGAPTGDWLNLYYKELQVELGAMRKMQERIVAAVTKTMKRGGGAELSTSRSLISQWMEPLTAAIEAEQRLVLNGKRSTDRAVVGPYLLLLPAHVLASATLHGFITSALMSDQMGLVKLIQPCISIGKNVQQQVEMDLMRTKAKRVNRQRLVLQRKLEREPEAGEGEDEWSPDWFRSWREKLLKDPKFENMDESIIRKELAQRFKKLQPYRMPDPADSSPDVPLGSSVVAERREGAPLEIIAGSQARVLGTPRRGKALARWQQVHLLNTYLDRARKAANNWEQDKVAKVGARLLQLMMQNCQITLWDPELRQKVPQPAMQHFVLQLPMRKQGWIQLDNSVTSQLHRLKEIRAFLMPAYQPMVIPPLPWQGTDFGGYLVTRSYIMRHRSFKPQRDALDAADRTASLGKVYGALNALGETAWRIDKDMLALISHAANAQLLIGDLPSAEDTPIIEPVKRPRFRLSAGGFWQSSEPAGGKAPSEQANEVLAALAAPSQAQLDDPPHSEAYVLSLSGEGDATMAPKRRSRGAFRRTQLLATFTKAETELEQRTRRNQNVRIRKLNRERYSLHCDMKLKLQVAQQFKEDEAIFFPHNLDFRGRAYPMHPHLNHLGNDMCRGLLEFADGRPLGRDGLSWLYIQLANTWGQGEDKKSFEGRRQFVEDHLQDVLRSAEHPLRHTWWQAAEEPWQFLAACKDVARALESGDPAGYVSHKPVMIDGSCNGLQHYAALGRDRPGGAAVNLIAADRPQDVYTQVANLVRERIDSEAEAGSVIAAIVAPQVDRKLVKQTVMTSVYGVTFVGARDQIEKRLQERGWQGTRPVDAFLAAQYAAQHTLDGLHKRFQEAKLVMEWLSDCARAIAATGKEVQWTTPLGLPVIQPYKQMAKKHVRTSLQRLVLQDGKQEGQPIVKARQRTAFPPNFIHSIDSTHMMMTATACKEAGLAFAGVHDSYWTHAADVPQMNCLLREAFVALYQRPLLEDLAAQFKARYPGIALPPVPPKGDLVIEEILDSPYFFS